QAEDGIRDFHVTGVQTCALPILPGQKFRRSDIIRTQQKLGQLGYFAPDKIGQNLVPNPANGTVDIEWQVEEQSNDQVELSGGWRSEERRVGKEWRDGLTTDHQLK